MVREPKDHLSFKVGVSITIVEALGQHSHVHSMVPLYLYGLGWGDYRRVVGFCKGLGPLAVSWRA